LDRGRTRSDKIRLDKIVGGNIRRERELRKITRDELAEILDLTTSHLGLIERGERGATSVTLEKVVNAFGVSIDNLFSESGKATSARENRDNGTYRKKVNALISHLTEPELLLLTHTIKGILVMRKSGGSEDNEIFDEFYNED
jgi:transcriptional regulator with XRE-family HTH domain